VAKAAKLSKAIDSQNRYDAIDIHSPRDRYPQPLIAARRSEFLSLNFHRGLLALTIGSDGDIHGGLALVNG
jgi:hypothetical protein